MSCPWSVSYPYATCGWNPDYEVIDEIELDGHPGGEIHIQWQCGGCGTTWWERE